MKLILFYLVGMIHVLMHKYRWSVNKQVLLRNLADLYEGDMVR